MNDDINTEDIADNITTDVDTTNQQTRDSELQNIIEAALFSAKEPLSVRNLINLFPEDAQPSKSDVQNVLLTLEHECETRGIELKHIGKGWRFQSKEKYATWLRNLESHRAPRYSRALLETLAIISYRQPVTRGDIEEIRGVAVSSETIRTLEEREWVKQIGHRDVPGRPALFGTTQRFLEYFNLASLRELPELMDKRELGEIAKDMNLTLPMDGVNNDELKSVELNSDEANANTESASAEVITLHPGATTGANVTDGADVSDVALGEDEQPLADEDIDSIDRLNQQIADDLTQTPEPSNEETDETSE